MSRGALGAAVILAASLAAGCVPQVEAPGAARPVHQHAPRQTRVAPPPVQPAPLTPKPSASTAKDWRDAPRTPGDWSWGSISNGTRASYSAPSGTPVFTMTCERAAHQVVLIRPAASSAPVPLQITTTFATHTYTATPVAGGLAVAFNAQDPQLDAMAFSRGRFAISVSGLPTLYLPSWAEVGRVIEDCR